MKLLKTMFSPGFSKEILLSIEIVVIVLLSAILTAPVSYQLYKQEASDALWNNRRTIYYGSMPGASEILPVKDLLENYPEIADVCLSDARHYMLVENGSVKRNYVALCINEAMFRKIHGLIFLDESVRTEGYTLILVSKEASVDYPAGTVLVLQDEEQTEIAFIVAGHMRTSQLPVISGIGGSILGLGQITGNTEEARDHAVMNFVMVDDACSSVPGAMIELKDDADREKILDDLSDEYVNCGSFFNYEEITRQSWKYMPVSEDQRLFLLMLVMVFVVNFLGYMALSAFRKQRTNALLSAFGMTPVKLGLLNAVSVLLITIPAFVISILFIPWVERLAGIVNYGGRKVLILSMVIIAALSLLLSFLTVWARLRKGNAILFYREG